MNSYRIINLTLLLSFVLMTVAIVIMHLTGRGDCAARILWGRECILCGCTRDFFSLFNGECNFINPISPWVFALIGIELPWRMFAALKRTIWQGVIVADYAIHALMLIALSRANIMRLFS